MAIVRAEPAKPKAEEQVAWYSGQVSRARTAICKLLSAHLNLIQSTDKISALSATTNTESTNEAQGPEAGVDCGSARQRETILVLLCRKFLAAEDLSLTF